MSSTAKVGFFTKLKSTLLSVGGKEGDEGPTSAGASANGMINPNCAPG
jgi:hypothetical protein